MQLYVTKKKYTELRISSRGDVIKVALLLLWWSFRYPHFTFDVCGRMKGRTQAVKGIDNASRLYIALRASEVVTLSPEYIKQFGLFGRLCFHSRVVKHISQCAYICLQRVRRIRRICVPD